MLPIVERREAEVKEARTRSPVGGRAGLDPCRMRSEGLLRSNSSHLDAVRRCRPGCVGLRSLQEAPPRTGANGRRWGRRQHGHPGGSVGDASGGAGDVHLLGPRGVSGALVDTPRRCVRASNSTHAPVRGQRASGGAGVTPGTPVLTSDDAEGMVPTMPASDNDKGRFRAFWTTTPGVITATAGMLTAIAGLITALATAGLIPRPEREGTPASPSASTTRLPVRRRPEL